MQQQRQRTLVSIAVAVALATSLTKANIATPFEYAAGYAELVLHVRCLSAEPGAVRLEVIESLKGVPPNGSITISRSDWFFRPLIERHEYVVLLSSEPQPYVGEISGDPNSTDRRPAFTCGTTNVLEFAKGKLLIEGQPATTVKGRELTYENIKAELNKRRS